jgi:prepilin-type N-terminal cleavage/methylation domain-containing protein
MPNRHAAIHNLRSHGFTLIEIVITIVITAIFASLAANIIMSGVKSYSAEESRSNVHYQTRMAVERMAREIRTIRSATVADIGTMTTTTLLYTNISGSQMGFRLNAGNIERTENNGTNWYTLATNITSPTIFTYFDNTGTSTANQTALWLVQIQATATQNTESITMSARVHPMNF